MTMYLLSVSAAGVPLKKYHQCPWNLSAGLPAPRARFTCTPGRCLDYCLVYLASFCTCINVSVGDCSFTTPWNTLCLPSSLHFAAWLFKSLWYDSGWLLASSVLLHCLMQINHDVFPACSSSCSCRSTIRVDSGRERFPRRRICWDMLEAIISCKVACRFLLIILSTNSCLLNMLYTFCWIFSFITTLGLSQKYLVHHPMFYVSSLEEYYSSVVSQIT